MDESAFDRLVLVLTATGSRRGLLGRLSALPLFGGLFALLDPDESDANGRRKQRKKRHKHGKGRRRKHDNDKKPCKSKNCLGSGDCTPACGPGQVCQGGVCGVACSSHFCPAASEICDLDRKLCRRCDVCPSGCLHASVAEAVAEARAATTIIICPGRYEEQDSIAISQDLTLYGAGAGDDPASATILDGNRLDRPVVIVSSSLPATIRRLSITNGSAATAGSSSGGGIFNNRGELTLEDVTIAKCDADVVGGGIFNLEGQLTLERTTISECTAGNSGGGIANATGSGVTLKQATVSGCTAEGDGHDDGFGGGIFNDGDFDAPGSVQLLDGSTVSDCTAAIGGGIFNRGTLSLEDALVSGNSAAVRGGGVFTTGVVEIVGETAISGNRSTTEAAGQGVDNDGGSVTCQEEIENPVVCDNPDDATATAASNCAGVTDGSCRGVCLGNTTPGSGACTE